MKIVLSIIFLIFFLFWTFRVKQNEVNYLDNKVYNRFKIKEPFISFYKLVTILGSAPFLIVTCTLIVLIFHNKMSLLIVIFMLIEWILNNILKLIVKRKRPNIRRLVIETGYSYPSGHTMSSSCFYGGLIYLISMSSFLLYLKIILIIGLLLIILLVCFSRIYLGVHYFSDIVGGILFSISYILLYVYLMYDVLSIL